MPSTNSANGTNGADPVPEREIELHASLAAVLGQVFAFTDDDGWEYHFDVAAGYRFARASGQAALVDFAFRESGVGMEELRRRYPDLSDNHVRSLPEAALKEPVLFVPWRGKHLLIDGWHRLAKAVTTECLDTLPAYMLTPEETRRIIIAKVNKAKKNASNAKRQERPQTEAAAVELLFARRFPPGQLVATVGAMAAICAAGDSPLRYLLLHLSGEWGELDAEDKAANERAVGNGGRILSSYRLRNGALIWVITESDRSCTTVLTPSEY